jgi:hypothetical protein
MILNIKTAVETGTILAKELNPDEQEIIGNSFLVIGTILTKIKSAHHDNTVNKCQQAREIQLERLEIEMEIQNLQKRIANLAVRATFNPLQHKHQSYRTF